MPVDAKSQDDRNSGWTRKRLCVLVVGVFTIFGGAHFDATAQGAEASGMAVSVVQVSSACFDDTVKLTGYVVPRHEVLVRPDVEGYHVAKVLVDDGVTVHAGQKLADLIKPDWLPELLPATAKMTAPADGILVMPRPVPIGMPVSARAAPPFRIIRDGEFEIDIEVPQSVIKKVKAGESVQIQTLDGNDIAGTLRVVDSNIDFLTQVAHARVRIAGKPKLRVGTFATAKVDTGRDCNAAVPLSAVLFGRRGPVVQVVENGHVTTRDVTIGLFSGAAIEIRKGVRVGNTVVARAGPFLRDGDAVRPFPWAALKAAE